MVPRYTLPRVRAAPGVQQQGKARQLALGDWFVMRPILVWALKPWLKPIGSGHRNRSVSREVFRSELGLRGGWFGEL